MSSLVYQFKCAVDSNFEPGRSKFDDKIAGEMNDTRIYSYADRRNLIETGSDFAKFVRAEFPEIRQAKQIAPEHVRSFLESKTDTCTQRTIDQYATRLEKLSRCLQEHFGGDRFKYTCDVPESQILDRRSLTMDRADLEKVFEHATPCSSSKAVELAAETGLRAAPLSRVQAGDYDREAGTLEVHGDKGGKDHVINLSPEAKAKLDELTRGKEPGEFLFTNKDGNPLKPNSINRWLQDHLKSEGITKYAEAKTSIHAIRKMYAKEEYARARAEGLTDREARDRVNVQLGHGTHRYDVEKAYLGK